MKALASSVVVASGCWLWSAGANGVNLAYQAGGNRHAGELAVWGGVAVTVIGLVFLTRLIYGAKPTD